jgi:AcrR family transcriptional regulator
MSKSGLFDHFGSKEGLQLATVDVATAKLWREVVEPATEVPHGLDRLRALIERYIAYLERDVFPGGCFLTAAAVEFDGRPGPVRDAIVAASRAWARELETESQIAQRQGELPPDVDPEQLVFQLGAYTNRANAVYQLYGDHTAFERARLAVARALG